MTAPRPQLLPPPQDWPQALCSRSAPCCRPWWLSGVSRTSWRPCLPGIHGHRWLWRLMQLSPAWPGSVFSAWVVCLTSASDPSCCPFISDFLHAQHGPGLLKDGCSLHDTPHQEGRKMVCFWRRVFWDEMSQETLPRRGVGQGSVSWVGGHCCRLAGMRGSLGEVHLNRCVPHPISSWASLPREEAVRAPKALTESPRTARRLCGAAPGLSTSSLGARPDPVLQGPQ